MTQSYFAYGSNMCAAHVRAKVASARFIAVATLPGHVLRFHKRGLDGSAKCNAYFTGKSQDELHGVLWTIDQRDRAKLDMVEGMGRGYAVRNAVVFVPGGRATAFFYIADLDHIDERLFPFTWYKDQVLAGARRHGLPPRYVEYLEGVSAIEDPDVCRQAEQQRLLAVT